MTEIPMVRTGRMKMNKIAEVLEGIRTVGIAGHAKPDGDCFGSCIGLYLYIREWFPEIRTDLYLEDKRDVFSYLDGFDAIRTEPEEGMIYDLFITCDVSSRDRIAVAGALFCSAGKTVCIDHHISNPGFADINHVCGEIGSASEVLYTLMEPEKVVKSVATALYTGMIHDTGVFQYSSTSPETMRIAGELMRTGFDFSRIIEESFYQKTYLQNQIMGRVLAESILLLDGKVIAGYLKKKDMEFYGAAPSDLEGIVSQLRLTQGVEAAMLLYENENGTFKVSLRSAGNLDVSRVAVYFGGGGHVKAAGCTIQGSVYDVMNNITAQVEQQLSESSYEEKE